MALQSSGQIKLSEIAAEYGDSAPHALSEFYGKGNAPASGEIQAAADFYGTSANVQLELRVYGAQGGDSAITNFGGTSFGGHGGYTNWQGTVESSQTLTLYVGGAGGTSSRGRGGAGGGGSSAVLIGSTVIAVAGAGGGGGASGPERLDGGTGGGTEGGHGLDANRGGNPGTQSAAGAGGPSSRGSNGSSGSGANGGNGSGGANGGTVTLEASGGWGYGTGGNGYNNTSDGGAGGGGGGFFGGGGGGCDSTGHSGGGGSGYRRTSGLPSGISHTSSTSVNGSEEGNGRILIYENGTLVATKNYTGGTQTHTVTV